MRYEDDAQLDASQVTDDRDGEQGSGGGFGGGGFGGGGFGGGGAGGGLLALLLGFLFRGRSGKASWVVIVVVVIGFVASQYLGGGGSTAPRSAGGFGDPGGPSRAGTADLAQECRTGADANTKPDCAIVADINSVQAYWGPGGGYAALAPRYRGAAARYQPVDTVFFTGSVRTRCGSADASAGPFYCPGDRLVYIDLSFYDQLRTQFGAEGGPLVNAYVLAHEYGHHVQDLLGTEATVRSRQGASSDSVRLELQADCYAGVWMNHASQSTNGRPAFISGITRADLDATVDAAQRIGDDYIQGKLGGGTVDPDSFTHGSSAQRKRWLSTGFTTGDGARCDTFAARDLG